MTDPGPPQPSKRWSEIFGPLNSVRIVLVAGAVIAALVGGFSGYWEVSVILLIGVIAHGFGWWYLYRKSEGTDDHGN